MRTLSLLAIAFRHSNGSSRCDGGSVLSFFLIKKKKRERCEIVSVNRTIHNFNFPKNILRWSEKDKDDKRMLRGGREGERECVCVHEYMFYLLLDHRNI